MTFETNPAAIPPLTGDLVDCHVHVFGPSREVAQPRHPHPDYAATLADVAALGAPFGIGRFVLTQPSFLGFDNSHLLERVSQHPQRLRAVAWLSDETDPRHLERLAGQKVVGLRFPLKYLKSVPDWGCYSDIFDEAGRHGIHVELGMHGAELVNAARIILDRGLTVVVAHLGAFDAELGPDADPHFQMLLDLASTRRVWVKLSAPYRASRHADRGCSVLVERLGADRCVWGSDWPHVGPALDRVTTYSDSMHWLRRCVPDQDVQRQILRWSPDELYRFDK